MDLISKDVAEIDDFIEDEEEEEEEGIFWATTHNKYDQLKEILEQNPESIRSVDSDGYSALHKASYNNNYELAKLLLQYNADPNAQTEFKWTPLHSACKWNNSKTAALLLQHGSEVNALTEGQQTPLHIAATAARNSKDTLVTLLMNSKVDTNILNNSNEKSEDLAKRSGPFLPLFKLGHSALKVETGIID